LPFPSLNQTVTNFIPYSALKVKLTSAVESVEGGALLSDARYPTTPLLSVAVKFNVTLLDVVVVVALLILRVPVGASSSGEL